MQQLLSRYIGWVSSTLGTDNRLAIVQYWHSKTLPAEIKELIRTFGERNPEMRYFLFNHDQAERFIGDRLGGREVAAFRSCAVPAMQADYFRYCAVYVLGGVYSDVDFCCRRPLHSMLDDQNYTILFRREPMGHLVNGFFAAKRPNSRLMKLAIDAATATINQRIANDVGLVTGPWIFNSLEFIHRSGSLEAARHQGVSAGKKRLADTILGVVGDYERIEEAFSSVDIWPLDSAMHWIGKPRTPLTYKESNEHWPRWQRRASIFQ